MDPEVFALETRVSAAQEMAGSNSSTGRGFIESSGETTLFYECSVPANHDGPMVVIFHGYGEHCGRYDHVVRLLEEAGMAWFRFDFRGHGQSSGRRGHIDRFDDYLDDSQAAVDAARNRSPESPLYILGHSQGGLISLVYLSERNEALRGAIVTSPNIGFAFKVPAWKAIVGRAMSRLIPTLSLPADLDASTVSRDSEVVKAYVADPLVHGVASARWFTEVVAAQERILANANGIKTPLFVIQAGDDKLVDPEMTKKLFASLGSEDKTIEVYDGLYHEVLNEPEGESIMGSIVEWISARG